MPRSFGAGRAARVQMVVIDGHLAHSSRERDRQLAGRNHVAEEGVDDGRSAHRSRMPRVEHRASLLREPAKGQRPPGRDDGDHRLLCPGDLGGKLFLGTGQAEKGARVRLARKARVLAHEEDHRVGRPRRIEGRGEAVVTRVAA